MSDPLRTVLITLPAGITEHDRHALVRILKVHGTLRIPQDRAISSEDVRIVLQFIAGAAGAATAVSKLVRELRAWRRSPRAPSAAPGVRIQLPKDGPAGDLTLDLEHGSEEDVARFLEQV